MYLVSHLTLQKCWNRSLIFLFKCGKSTFSPYAVLGKTTWKYQLVELSQLAPGIDMFWLILDIMSANRFYVFFFHILNNMNVYELNVGQRKCRLIYVGPLHTSTRVHGLMDELSVWQLFAFSIFSCIKFLIKRDNNSYHSCRNHLEQVENWKF